MAPLFMMIDRADILADFAELLGFGWNGVGFELTFPAAKSAMAILDYTSCKAMYKLSLILCMPEGAIDLTEANEWMPSPASMSKMERDSWMLRVMGSTTVLSLGARAYVRLGRLDEAFETASIAVRVAFSSAWNLNFTDTPFFH